MTKKAANSTWWWIYLFIGITSLLIGGTYLVAKAFMPAPAVTTGTVEGFELYVGNSSSSNPHNHCYALTVGWEVDGKKFTKTTRWPVKNFGDCQKTPEDAAEKAKTWIGRELKVYYQAEWPGTAEIEGERDNLAESTPGLVIVGLAIIGWCIWERRRKRA